MYVGQLFKIKIKIDYTNINNNTIVLVVKVKNLLFYKLIIVLTLANSHCLR